MTTLTTLQRVAAHLNAFRARPSIQFTDVIYGPRAKPLRTQVAAMILDRKVTGSDKEAQYGRLRLALLVLANVTDGTCKADEDDKLNKALNGALLSTVEF